MKHSIAIKFLAFLLCALSVVSIAACGFGILFMENWNLYNQPLEDIKMQQLDSLSTSIAWNHAQLHAAQSLSNCPQEILDDVLTHTTYVPGNYAVEIFQEGELVYHVNNREDLRDHYVQELRICPNYPIVTYQYTHGEQQPAVIDSAVLPTQPPEFPSTEPFPTIEFDVQESGLMATAPYGEFQLPSDSDAATIPYGEFQLPTEPIPVETMPAETAPADPLPAELPAVSAQWASARDSTLERVRGQDVVYSSEHSETFWTERGEPYEVTYILDYYTAPEYQVVVYLENRSVLGTEYALMSLLYPYRTNFIPVLLASLLVLALTLVYLFAAAGHSKSGEIHPVGLNKLPLDIYAVGATSGILLLLILLTELLDSFGRGYYSIWDNIPLCMLILGSSIFGIALFAIGFLYACVAQAKVKGGYWWRHSICGRLFQQLVYFFRWVRRGLQYFYRGCRAVVRLLPLTWQWLLTAFGMVLVPLLFLLFRGTSHGFGEAFWLMMFFLSAIADIALVCYGAWCFGVLLKGVRHMAQGNLNHQINTRFLFGCFKDFALHLNSLAGAAQQAAEKQMKSERMKTELITNVSHDIKTPLTSIINYVDLMKMPHSEEDHGVYLDVLDRQSQRLKKLIDDLMDMSKASSGNMSVELGQVDVTEAVNQALGEFADKLEQANLTPVFRHPDHSVVMQADGRLLWRILSNILSNAVKYAMPNTRLYVDLMVLDGNAVLAIKNISSEQLNVNADELMERFVRGDASRNTEGSGLGLNIAKSLAELQHGQMHLMVDGDLFKVTLIFPLI